MNIKEFIKILIKHGKRFSLSREIKKFIYGLADMIPTIAGNYLRWKVAKFFMKERMGKNVHIRRHANFSFDNISIGDNVLIGAYRFLYSYKGGEITIGSDTMIGDRVKIYTMNHKFENKNIPIRLQGGYYAPIKIGKDVWIGADSIILLGVTIGDGAVIGAGSVVCKDIPLYTLAAGNPVRIIRKREEIINKE